MQQGVLFLSTFFRILRVLRIPLFFNQYSTLALVLSVLPFLLHVRRASAHLIHTINGFQRYLPKHQLVLFLLFVVQAFESANSDSL